MTIKWTLLVLNAYQMALHETITSPFVGRAFRQLAIGSDKQKVDTTDGVH